MTGEQHNDHCLIFGSGQWWIVRKVEGMTLITTCPCGCTTSRFAFPADFDFAGYCNTAAMMLAAITAREERGGLPVSAGSAARN
jgi:hypothetical protein